MPDSTVYLCIEPETKLPNIANISPFRVVVIAEEAVSVGWQMMVSDWLVISGCLYMMAWGINCSSWDDSVDIANLNRFQFGEIPDEEFIMTTWHDDDPLKEVFWFSKELAFHSTVEIKYTLLLHISKHNRQDEFLEIYSQI